MMRKNISACLAALTIFSVIIAFGFIDEPSAAIELRVSTYMPEDSLWAGWLRYWGGEIEKRTMGQVKVKSYYYAGALLKAETEAVGVGKAMADVCLLAPGYAPSLFPISAAVSTTPYALGDGRLSPYIMNEIWDEFAPLRDEWHKMNLEYLFASTGADSVIGLNRKVLRLEELQGLKMRAIGIWNQVFQRLGAIPVAISPQDAYTAIQRNQIQGFAGTPPYVCLDHHYEEIAKIYIDPGFGTYSAFCAAVMNMDTYKKLPESAKKVIQDLRWEMRARVVKEEEIRNARALEQAVKNKVEIYVLPPDEEKRWREKIKPEELWAEWLGPKGRGKGLPAASQLLDLYRAKVPVWEKKAPQDIMGLRGLMLKYSTIK